MEENRKLNDEQSIINNGIYNGIKNNEIKSDMDNDMNNHLNNDRSKEPDGQAYTEEKPAKDSLVEDSLSDDKANTDPAAEAYSGFETKSGSETDKASVVADKSADAAGTEPDKKSVKTKLTKGQKYKKLKRMMKTTKTMAICSSRVEMYKYLAKQFDKLKDYKNSQELAEKCRKKAKKTKKLIKQQIYETAVNLKNTAERPEDYKLAAVEFRKLSGYLDAYELAAECELLAAILEKRLTVRRIAVLSILILLIISAFIFSRTPYAKYRLANMLAYTGSYDSAIKIYKKLGSFHDSDEKISEAQYKKGLRLMEEGSYKDALKAMEAAGEYKDSQKLKADIEKHIIKNSPVKSTVRLGKYDWLILEMDNSRALLMKKTSIAGIPYNDSLKEVTWEESSLRAWLNSDFYNDSFSAEEQKNIVPADLQNPANASNGTEAGRGTMDYIFILSIEEAQKYKDIMPESDHNIWLRSPGSSLNKAAFISADKIIMENGYEVDSDKLAIRPVLWFSLE